MVFAHQLGRLMNGFIAANDHGIAITDQANRHEAFLGLEW
jgi:hypothetical protein